MSSLLSATATLSSYRALKGLHGKQWAQVLTQACRDAGNAEASCSLLMQTIVMPFRSLHVA